MSQEVNAGIFTADHRVGAEFNICETEFDRTIKGVGRRKKIFRTIEGEGQKELTEVIF